jgi:radical SAM superfamily enzyme YgiQ (UPF0313 family)
VSNQIPIAYIHPCYGTTREEQLLYPLMPVGLPAVINAVRAEGFDVRGISLPLELRLDPSFSLESWLADIRPQLVLIDLQWYLNLAGAMEVATRAKRACPSCTVAVGGQTASVFSEDLLGSSRAIDLVIRGDGEEVAPLVARAVIRAEGRIEDLPNLTRRGADGMVATPLECVTQDLDSLNYLDIDFLDHAREYLYTSLYRQEDLPVFWVALARSCPYACYHCGGSRSSQEKTYGRPSMLVRSVSSVADDVETLSKRGVGNVHFTHDLALLGRPYYHALFADLRSRGVSVGGMNPMWQHLPDDEFLADFTATFVKEDSYLNISPESGVEELRTYLHGGRTYTNHELVEAMDRVRRYGLPWVTYFRLNMPWENSKTLEITTRLAALLMKEFSRNVPAFMASDVPLDPWSTLELEPERFPFRYPPLSFDDYVTFSLGRIDPLKIWCDPPPTPLSLRPYPELDELSHVDLLFVKKLLPRLWVRWQEVRQLEAAGDR